MSILGNTHFLVKLLLSSFDVFHLHSFLAHDRTERGLIIIITTPCLNESKKKALIRLVKKEEHHLSQATKLLF